MKVTFFILLMTFSFSAFCQVQTVVEIDKRLHGLYSDSQLKQFQKSNPQLLERLNYYLDHAFIITDENENKPTEFSGTVTIEDLTNFNILEIEKNQQLKRSWDKVSVYKIKGTNQLLVYHPGRNFNRDFNKHYQKIR